MAWYAASGARRARQITADAMVVAWAALCWVTAWTMKQVIDALAVPAEKTASAARTMTEEMRQVEEKVRRVPVAGDDLSSPFGSMAGGLQRITEESLNSASTIHQVAWWTFAVLFLVPLTAAIWLWLPRRLTFLRESRAAQRFIDSAADLDLFALRAMANLPMRRIAAISDDPVAAWRTGDRATIRRLAKLELDRLGLALPADLPAAPPAEVSPR